MNCSFQNSRRPWFSKVALALAFGAVALSVTSPANAVRQRVCPDGSVVACTKSCPKKLKVSTRRVRGGSQTGQRIAR